MLGTKLLDFNDDFNDNNYDNVHYTGWIPPIPDLRDYNEHKITDIADKLLIPVTFGFGKNDKLPTSVDLEEYCSPIRDQLALGSCCAQATVSAVEYCQRRAYNTYIPGSRLFIYKVMRNLMCSTGDIGGYLRTAMGALVLFGLPPEKYCPYKISEFDKEPSAFLYGIADNYEATKYFCHDPQHITKNKSEVIWSVKKYLAAGIPSVFGTFIYPSYSSNGDGTFPYPSTNETVIGGHALFAVGYDDNKVIINYYNNTGIKTKGAIKFQNSWGVGWGDNGFGWLPYKYIEDNLAQDFWSLINMEWTDTGNFGL